MRGVGQAGTVRRSTPVPAPPAWSIEDQPIRIREREAIERLSDEALTAAMVACGLSPFMARITTEDRTTAGGLWRIVHEFRDHVSVADATFGNRWPALTDTVDLGVRISDEWSAETCSWHIDFDSAAGESWPWVVVLEWTSEYDNAHHADWVTFTWQFYGETVEIAMVEAAGWVEALAQFRPCDLCGGAGCEEGCGRCEMTPRAAGPDAHRQCTRCHGSGVESSGEGNAS